MCNRSHSQTDRQADRHIWYYQEGSLCVTDHIQGVRTDRQTHRQTETHTDRQTGRQIGQTHRHTDTQTGRQTDIGLLGDINMCNRSHRGSKDRQTNRHTYTQTDTHTDRHTDRQTLRQTLVYQEGSICVTFYIEEDRQTDTLTDRQTDIQTHTHTDSQAQRHTDRQIQDYQKISKTHTQTHRQMMDKWIDGWLDISNGIVENKYFYKRASVFT